jgi:hypothetical protein
MVGEGRQVDITKQRHILIQRTKNPPYYILLIKINFILYGEWL